MIGCVVKYDYLVVVLLAENTSFLFFKEIYHRGDSVLDGNHIPIEKEVISWPNPIHNLRKNRNSYVFIRMVIVAAILSNKIIMAYHSIISLVLFDLVVGDHT